jgi:hypothetical protein
MPISVAIMERRDREVTSEVLTCKPGDVRPRRLVGGLPDSSLRVKNIWSRKRRANASGSFPGNDEPASRSVPCLGSFSTTWDQIEKEFSDGVAGTSQFLDTLSAFLDHTENLMCQSV